MPLPLHIELALSVLHNVIGKVKPNSESAKALGKALEQLTSHMTRHLRGLPWPVPPTTPTPPRAPAAQPPKAS